MGGKFVCVVLLALVANVYSNNREIVLDEEEINYISNPIFGTSMSIAKSWFDTLVSCYIAFPSGALYEAYPIDRIQHPGIEFMNVSQPFRSCAVKFLGVGSEVSGLYELLSTVESSADDTMTLTRKKFNLNVTEIWTEWPFNSESSD